MNPSSLPYTTVFATYTTTHTYLLCIQTSGSALLVAACTLFGPRDMQSTFPLTLVMISLPSQMPTTPIVSIPIILSWSTLSYITQLLSPGASRNNLSGSEIMALHKGASKTLLLCQLLTGMGFPPTSSTPIFEDNQGTIKLIRTHRLTDTVCHFAVKIAWLHDKFLANHLHAAYTKTSMQLADCSTKPVNGSQLFQSISYAIGQHYYPSPHHHHYTLLDLDTYSYLHGQHTLVHNFDRQSIQSPSSS
jgi:hypothetical protein